MGGRRTYATAAERRGGGHGADHVLGAQRHGKTGIRRAPAEPDEPQGSPCLSDPQGALAQGQARSLGRRGQRGRLAPRRPGRHCGDATDAAGAHCKSGGGRGPIGHAAPAYPVDAGIVAAAQRLPPACSEIFAAAPRAHEKESALGKAQHRERIANRGFRPSSARAKAQALLKSTGDKQQMAKLPLSFACGLYDRMQPLYTSEVTAEGIDLNFIAIDQPRPIFDRMAGGEEFDVAEFSSSEFVQRFASKQCPFVAIPVFPSRAFRHGFIAVHRKAGIKTPKDLEGKRVGVPLFTMTAAIYINGLLQHEYGVDLRKIHWVQGAMNTGGAHGTPTVLPLLPNYVELEKAFYKRTKIYPFMHLVAIRKQLYERYPFIATSLYNAFCESKKIALEKMFNLRALRYMTPFLMRDIDEIYELFDGDPWPYGVEPNRPTLEAFVTYLTDQSLIAAPVAVDDLFVPTY